MKVWGNARRAQANDINPWQQAKNQGNAMEKMVQPGDRWCNAQVAALEGEA